MVWDGGSGPLVVPTRRALIGVALGGAPVWPCGGEESFTEKSVRRRPPRYLPLGQLTVFISVKIHYFGAARAIFTFEIKIAMSNISNAPKK